MSACKSSFDGKLDELPGVYVDNFENPFGDNAKAYFLSHFHSDHTVGLNSEALFQKLLKRRNVFIYVTRMTAAIIKSEYAYLEDYVKILKIGSNLITLPGDLKKKEQDIYVNVKLIPAGHCLGSVMFLFETTAVKVLYTGDFRIRPNDIPNYAALHDKDGNVVKLDALYIETTFIDAKYESFPKRTHSVQEAVDKISRLLESDRNLNVILDTNITRYGYEYLYNQIYEVLHMKVYVPEDRWAFYRTVRDLVPGVTNDTNTRVFLKNKGLYRYLANRNMDYVTMRFSAMNWWFWSEGPAVHDSGDSMAVCFSTHCSREELRCFVDYLEPTRVVGFPHPYDLHRLSGDRTSDRSDEEDTSDVRSDGDRCEEEATSDVDKERVVVTPRKTPRKRSSQSPYEARSRTDRKVSDTLLKQLFSLT